eukprot:GHVU01212877.1.p1 GENE.GHVU01212877.1~~GHVU01212877.1.p1  ORF type:complete len:228 (-),score=29.90 GHVU01212877.1:2015-2698(-)
MRGSSTANTDLSGDSSTVVVVVGPTTEKRPSRGGASPKSKEMASRDRHDGSGSSSDDECDYYDAVEDYRDDPNDARDWDAPNPIAGSGACGAGTNEMSSSSSSGDSSSDLTSSSSSDDDDCTALGQPSSSRRRVRASRRRRRCRRPEEAGGGGDGAGNDGDAGPANVRTYSYNVEELPLVTVGIVIPQVSARVSQEQLKCILAWIEYTVNIYGLLLFGIRAHLWYVN